MWTCEDLKKMRGEGRGGMMKLSLRCMKDEAVGFEDLDGTVPNPDDLKVRSEC